MATFTIDLLRGTQYLFSGDFNGSGSTSGNTGIGWSSLPKGSTVAGCGTPPSSSSLIQNTIFGVQAGLNITSGCGNIAIGFQALYANTIGNDNFASGSLALYNNTGGTNNIAIGYRALYSNTCGTDNFASGNFALLNNTIGCNNIANGHQALFSNVTGSSNIALGYQAGYYETGSNKLYIANSSGCTLIGGDFATKCVSIGGQLKISGVTNGTCLNSALVWDSATCLVKKVPYISGSTVSWTTLSGRPAWLIGATLSAFQTGHTHSQYLTSASLNGYWTSGQTVSYINGRNFLTGVTWNQVQSKPAYLAYVSGLTSAAQTQLDAKSNILVIINAQTGLTYTLGITDVNKTITLTNASPITVTIPAFSGVSFSVGTTITFIQGGAGKVTFSGAAGVTIKSKLNNKSISAQNVAVSLLKESTNTWYLIGDLSA
jgi:hypothetical protein